MKRCDSGAKGEKEIERVNVTLPETLFEYFPSVSLQV